MSTEGSWQDTAAEDAEPVEQGWSADETDVELDADVDVDTDPEADAVQSTDDVVDAEADEAQPAYPVSGAGSWTDDWSTTPVDRQTRTTFEPTGEEPVDRALAELDGIDDLELAEHGAAYERAHRRLQEALSEVDGEADAMAGTS